MGRQRGFTVLELLVGMVIGMVVVLAAVQAVASLRQDSDVRRVNTDFTLVENWARIRYQQFCRTTTTGISTENSTITSRVFNQTLAWSAAYDFSVRANGPGNLEIRLNVTPLTAAQRDRLYQVVPNSQLVTLSGITYLRVLSQGLSNVGGLEQDNFRLMYQSDRC